MEECISQFWLLQQNTIDCLAQKRHLFSYGSGGWEAQDQGASRFGNNDFHFVTCQKIGKYVHLQNNCV